MYKKKLKRIIDILLILITILPLFIIGVIISILIKKDSKGKIFFKK